MKKFELQQRVNGEWKKVSEVTLKEFDEKYQSTKFKTGYYKGTYKFRIKIL